MPIEVAILQEFDRIEESAMYSAQGQYEQGMRWKRLHYGLGVPAAGLAAVAGAATLASSASDVWTGVVTLLAAFATGAVTAINPMAKADEAVAAANQYLALQGDARRRGRIDAPNLSDPAEARQQLEELAIRQNEINASAPVIPNRAYQKAKKTIETSGGQSYKTDAA